MTWATIGQSDQRLDLHDGVPTLKDLQAAVGGYVEVFEVQPDGMTMWFNEEGKYPVMDGKATPRELVNEVGTLLLREAGCMPGDWTAGDVAFTGGPDEEGETTGLSEAQLDALRGLSETP